MPQRAAADAAAPVVGAGAAAAAPGRHRLWPERI